MAESLSGVQLSTKWQEASNRGAAILSYLGEQVPLIYCLETEPQQGEEEQKVEQHLLYPLECFLFGEEPCVGLEKLQQYNSSSSAQQCGRVFKEGETVYTCRDCAIDPTCVLCIECFQKSVHKSHRYKMHASAGGGFCDCGDLEAWKSGPCCSQHDPGTSVTMETDECVMDPGLRERAQMLFHLLLRYTTDMLVWEETYELSEELKPKVKEDAYFCVLYNDEHHSYDHVIYTLQRAIACDQNQAQIYTALIDKEGRKAVKRGTLRSCQQAKDNIRRNSEHIIQIPLRVEILHTAVMAHQTFALRLGAWFQKIIGYLVGLREVFCQVALEPAADNDQLCLISRLMLHDAKLYKGARKVVHELIFSSLLMDTEFKRQFAMKFTAHYKQLQEDFISDDHQRNISVTALSVQIFTVPTLARQLIEEGSVIKVIIDTVMDMMSAHLDSNNRFQFQGHNPDKFFRVQVIFHDLRYILISKPSVWTETLRVKFLEGLRVFLRFLCCMQGMEEVKRQLGQHVEVEPEWEAGFTLQMQLRHILTMFQDWCSSDERVLLLAFQECHRALMSCTNQPFRREPTDSYMCKQILHARLYKVSQEPVSIHLPISRLLAGLYVQLCQTGAIQYLPDFVDPVQLNFTELAEQPLRCVVLAAQVCADMWRRNGLSLVSQTASKMDPNHFLMLVLLRFELFDIFNGNSSSKDQEVLKQWNRLTEEMLYLIIIIVGERYVPGISHVTKEDVTMREVIHLLCIQPMAHSSLVKSLPENALHLVGQALLEEKTQLESSSTEEVTFDFSLKAQTAPFEVVKCLREKSGPVASFSVDHSMLEESVQDKEKAERKRKAEAAKAHRQKIMAQMSAMQKNFIESNKMLYDNVPESSSQSDTAASVDSCRMDVDESRVAVGPQQGVCSTDWEAQICILCQEEQEVQAQAPAMVLTACVQRSTVLTQNRGKTLSPKGSYPLFMPPDLAVGTHTGSCGHVMHATCWQKYFEAVQNTTRNRLHADLIIDLENGEYMCPLCKSLCNTVIPLIPVEPKTGSEHGKSLFHFLTKIKSLPSLKAQNDMIMWNLQMFEVVKCLREKSGPVASFSVDHSMLEESVQDKEKAERKRKAEAAKAHRQKIMAQMSAMQKNFIESNKMLYDNVPESSSQSDTAASVDRPKFSRSITEMLGVCATTVHRVGLQTAPNDLCPYMPVMSWNTCAYTIQAIENMLQEEGKPLFGSLQNRQLSGLKALVQFSAAQRLKSSQAVVQKHFADMLAVLVPVPNVENTPSILEVDFFHLLVGLVLSIPALYQEEAVDLQPSAVSTAYNHLYLLHLLTMTHMLQVLLASHDCAVIGGLGEGDEAQAAAELFSIVSQHTDRLRAGVTGFCVEGVKRGVLPFLRCAALFFNCLTGVPPPEELSESPESQLHLLCSYLSLPSNLFQLFQDHRDVVTTLIKRWCENAAISKALKGEMQIIRYPHKKNRLIDLPEDYSVLLNQASHFKCPNSSDDERKHPTLCLLCGVMLCAQSPCCQEQLNGEDVGACTAHAAICGAGVGMFLRVRECEIILMASKTRGSPYPAPYLDDYGETDPQLGRGNPLHLCPERYRKLFHMWQQHCVLEEIARSLELLNVMFPFEWQML
ncbi:E3 ubiquitin-protein ligase UBR1-like [Sinocyclocheilus grahami]|uniref:E3 ubiquitin-protein ligase UBR1-like n=1 Tax=Sinocyclocheilus grahami TaxID=75366 RepID=UPI0007AD4CB8|nr:PREDICTED: E3 ubiquitin-protein ligase UBR1-like [Sinocyclocheilus grahami]